MVKMYTAVYFDVLTKFIVAVRDNSPKYLILILKLTTPRVIEKKGLD